MNVEHAPLEPVAVLRLCVVAEADPVSLQRVIERFQNLNILPRRMNAELDATGTLHIQVDVAGLEEERLTLIAAKIAEAPPILNAYWCRL